MTPEPTTSTMRVLRLTPFFHHAAAGSWPARYDSVGGMQVQTLRTSEWLARRGVEQLVLTLGFPGLPREAVPLPGLTVRTCRLAMPEVPSESTGLVGLVPSWTIAAAAAIERLDWTPDVIHVHADGEPYPLLLSQWAARRLRRPCVLTIHCARTASRRPVSRWDAMQNRATRWLEIRAARAASAVIALNADTAASLRQLAGVTAHVLPDTLDADRFCALHGERVAAFRTRHRLPSDRPIVAFIGRIAAEKGWADLVPLARALPEAQMLVVGDGPQADRLRAEIAAAGLAHRFTVTGFVPQADVAAALALATLVVMPSRHEELGGCALEALAMQRPVVAYAVGGLVTTVGAVAPDLLAPAGDVGRLAAIAARVLRDPAALAARLAHARQHVAERYHPDTVLPRLLQIYRRVTASDSTRSARVAVRTIGAAPCRA
jgi:2-deoxystreptamine N-acetyl-D-glucosaminyltransferase / 2-deoxystreptamine glucosyltransferase